MANAGKGMGQKTEINVGPTPPDALDIDDIASEVHGLNRLHGNDQRKSHNQRVEVPDVKRETEGVIESFENLDPKVRAGRA